MLEFLDGAHHAFTGILLDLPQPTEDKAIEQPQETTGSCNYTINLKRVAASGDPLLHSGVRVYSPPTR